MQTLIPIFVVDVCMCVWVLAVRHYYTNVLSCTLTNTHTRPPRTHDNSESIARVLVCVRMSVNGVYTWKKYERERRITFQQHIFIRRCRRCHAHSSTFAAYDIDSQRIAVHTEYVLAVVCTLHMYESRFNLSEHSMERAKRMNDFNSRSFENSLNPHTQHVWSVCVSLFGFLFVGRADWERIRELETERHRMQQLIADTNVILWEQQKRAKEFYACIGERQCVYDFIVFFSSIWVLHVFSMVIFCAVVVALFGLSYTHIQS